MIKFEDFEIKAWQRVKNALLWVILVGIVMLPRLLDLDIFIGPDEKILWGWANSFALSVSQGHWQETLVGDGYPAVTLMWVNTIGVAVKWLWLQLGGVGRPFIDVIGLDRPLELYAERRLFLALASGLLILAAYPLLRTVWGQRVAFLAVGLMAAEPLFLAFTRMVRADALLAGFMLLSVLATFAFVKTNDRRYNWLAGAMGGLAALSKLSGGITALTATVIYVVLAWHRGRQTGWSQGLRWLLVAVLDWGVSAALLFFGLWPAWWVLPIDTFNLLLGSAVYYTLEVTTTRAGTHFWGAFRPLGASPAFYWVLAALRLTPWLLLGSAVAVGRRLWNLIRQGVGAADGFGWGMLLSVTTYWVMISFVSLKTDRYFLPIIPGLAVLTAVETVGAGRWAMKCLAQRIATSLLPGAVVFGLGLLAVAHVAVYHPLYTTYFDPLVGNPKLVQWALPVGQGEGVNAALKYLSTLSAAPDSVVVCGTNFPRCRPFFDGELWHQEDLRSARWFGADYALLHIDELQVGAYPAGVVAYLRREPEIYVAEHHGIQYTWLYAVPHPSFFATDNKLEGVATLFGYDVKAESLSFLSPGDQLTMSLYWQNEGQAAQQRFWWRVVDSQGYVWSEAEAQPSPEFELDATQEGAVIEGEALISLPPDMPPGTYTLKAGFADAKGDVGQFGLPVEGSVLEVKGLSVGASQPSNALDTLLAPDLRLRGYDLSNKESIPGEASWVTLYWQAVEQPQHDYIFTLRLLDETEGEVASWSGRPVYDTFPTRKWPANTNVRDPWRISLPPDLSPGSYQLRLTLSNASDSGELARIDLGMITVVERRISFDVPTTQYPADHTFGDVATLLGYDLGGDLSPDGAHVRAMLYWRALRATDQPYAVSLRLVDANGAVLVEQESQPAEGTIPTTEWQPGEIVADLHEMDVAPGEPVSVNLEVRLLDEGGNSVPLPDGADTVVISDVQQRVMWRTSVP